MKQAHSPRLLLQSGGVVATRREGGLLFDAAGPAHQSLTSRIGITSIDPLQSCGAQGSVRRALIATRPDVHTAAARLGGALAPAVSQ